MALEGPLHQISVEEALRLIDQERRAGLLLVRRGGLSAGIYLDAGQILCAQRSGPGQTLGERLISAHLVTPQQLGQVRSMSDDRPIENEVDLARVLLQTNYLSRDALRNWVMADAVELLVVLLSWSEGILTFEESVVPAPGRMVIPLPIMAVLDESLHHIARRRQQTAPRVAVTPELVLDFAEAVEPPDGEIEISPDQWRFLTAVDGQLALRELAQALAVPPAIAQRLAGELLAVGILTVSGLHPDGASHLVAPPEPARREGNASGSISRPRQNGPSGSSGAIPAVNGRVARGSARPDR